MCSHHFLLECFGIEVLGFTAGLALDQRSTDGLHLKAALLLAPLFGVLRGRRYTYKWLTLFILVYFAEGIFRATVDHGLSRVLAMAETALSLIIFGLSILLVRATRVSESSAPPETR